MGFELFEFYGIDIEQLKAENEFCEVIGFITIRYWDENFRREQLQQNIFYSFNKDTISKATKGGAYFLELIKLKNSIILEALRVRNEELHTSKINDFIENKVKEFGILDLEKLKKISPIESYILHFQHCSMHNNMHFPLWLHSFSPFSEGKKVTYINYGRN